MPRPRRTRPPEPRVTEAEVLRACLQLLKLRGVPHWRNNTGAARVGGRYVRFGAAGSSDIVGLLPGGRFLAVEVKRPGGRLTPGQRAFLELVNGCGGVAVVVHDVAELAAALDAAAAEVTRK